MGNPSGPSGHLPYKAEEFCLRTDKLFAAMDFKSVAAYQRGSMKPFPAIFLLLQECLPTRLQIPRGRRFLCCFLLLLLRRVCAARMLHLLSKKTECHEMLVKNRQIVPFWMISVTRLLRNPAQIADFCAIFLHKTGLLCKFLSVSFTFLGGLTRNFGAGTRNSEPRNSFFGAWNFFFGARTKKFRYRNVFAAASGPFFFPVGTFSDTFPVSFCLRNPPAGFPAGRVSAPGVSRVPSKRQVRRGFRDILISASRVWLRFFRAVPARRANTRISEGENEQIVNAHPKVSLCQYRRCGRNAAPPMMTGCL